MQSDKAYFSCTMDPNVTRIKQTKHSDTPMIFHRSAVSVRFRRDFASYTLSIKNQVPIVGVVSQRFSKIVLILNQTHLQPRETFSLGYSSAEAAALWNKFAAGCNDPNLETLEITLGTNLQLDLELSFANYEEAVTVLSLSASAINRVFKHTVRNIMLVLPVMGASWTTASDRLNSLRLIAHSFGLPFYVLAQADIIKNPSEYHEWRRHVYSNVDKAIIRFEPFSKGSLHKIEIHGSLLPVLSNFKTEYEHLTHGLHDYDIEENVRKIGFWVDLYEKCGKLPVNRSDFVNFWVSLNAYSQEYNTSVFITPAISLLGRPDTEWLHVSSNGRHFTMAESFTSESAPNPVTSKPGLLGYINIAVSTTMPIAVAIILFTTIWRQVRKCKTNNQSRFVQEMKDFQTDTHFTTENDGLIVSSVRLAYDTNFEIDAKDITLNTV